MSAMLQSSALVLLLFALFRIFPGIPPKAQAWCWRLALVKIAVGAFSLLPVALPVLSPPPALQALAVPTGTVYLVATTAAPVTAPIAAAAPPQTHFNYWPWLWALGALCALAHLARRALAARKLFAQSTELEEMVPLTYVAQLCARARTRSIPRLRRSSLVSALTLLGGRRYTILLPKPLPDGTEPADLRLALAHEVAHIRRRDLEWSALAWLLRAILFFNPFAWLAFRELHATQESATDLEAIHLTGSSVPAYGHMLLRAMLSGPSSTRPSPATIGLNDSYRMAYRRLNTMKHFKKNPTALRKLAACLVVAAAIGAIPTYSLTPAEAQTPKPKHRVARTHHTVHRASRSRAASRVVISAPADSHLSLTYDGPSRTATVTSSSPAPKVWITPVKAIKVSRAPSAAYTVTVAPSPFAVQRPALAPQAQIVTPRGIVIRSIAQTKDPYQVKIDYHLAPVQGTAPTPAVPPRLVPDQATPSIVPAPAAPSQTPGTTAVPPAPPVVLPDTPTSVTPPAQSQAGSTSISSAHNSVTTTYVAGNSRVIYGLAGSATIPYAGIQTKNGSAAYTAYVPAQNQVRWVYPGTVPSNQNPNAVTLPSGQFKANYIYQSGQATNPYSGIVTYSGQSSAIFRSDPTAGARSYIHLTPQQLRILSSGHKVRVFINGMSVTLDPTASKPRPVHSDNQKATDPTATGGH